VDSIPAEITKLYTRSVIKRRPRDRAALVRHIRRTMNHSPLPRILPRGVVTGPTTVGGRPGDEVRVERPRHTVLYLHGGGYIAGRPRTYHSLAGRLARGLSARVVLPTYRLAPEHRFPAAHEDTLAVYRALLDDGVDPRHLSVMGDSAGGGLALALLLSARDAGLPMPRCAAVLSPFADLTLSAPSVFHNDRSDAMLSAHLIRLGGDIYHGEADAHTPTISPVFGDYRGLPPLFVSASEAECLYDDAVRVALRAREAGVPVELVSRPGLLHVWPIFVPYLPEARRDVDRLVAFVRRSGDPA